VQVLIVFLHSTWYNAAHHTVARCSGRVLHWGGSRDQA
jgi:hypothetical protein